MAVRSARLQPDRDGPPKRRTLRTRRLVDASRAGITASRDQLTARRERPMPAPTHPERDRPIPASCPGTLFAFEKKSEQETDMRELPNTTVPGGKSPTVFDIIALFLGMLT